MYASFGVRYVDARPEEKPDRARDTHTMRHDDDDARDSRGGFIDVLMIGEKNEEEERPK